MNDDRSLPVLVNVVNSLDPGGAERLVVDMSMQFSSTYRVVVICLDTAGTWSGQLRDMGIPVHVMRRQPGLDLLLSFRLARLLRSLSANIVHAHQTGAWFYSAIARLWYFKPRLLFQEHGRLFPEPDNRLRRFVNRILISRMTHRFVAVSRDIRERLVRYEGVRRERIEVIYNGGRALPRPGEAELAELRAELAIRPGSQVVGFVGRLDPVKNIDMLIKSVASLQARLPKIKCLIVGDGGERERLTELSHRLLAKDCAIFAGFRADAEKLIYCMDVFVLPSLSEGTSMALLEAMHAGVVPVVTAVGGNPELVEDGVNGYVVPSNDEQELAGAIEKALDSPDERASMAAAGKRKFDEKFSFDIMLANYADLYQQMITARV